MKPQVNIRVSSHYVGEYDKYLKNGEIKMPVPTYAVIKKNMKKYLSISYTNEVLVYRSRRGEWGEWFEYWTLINGKPKITKKGWL